MGGGRRQRARSDFARCERGAWARAARACCSSFGAIQRCSERARECDTQAMSRPALRTLSSPFVCSCSSANVPAAKDGRSNVSYPHQRSLRIILAYFPTTAGSAPFGLLCCQPGSVPGTLAARTSQLTPWGPCRLPVWSGEAIHMICRTWCIH